MRYYVTFLPLDVCDVLLGQPYLWERHAMYESRPRDVIVTLGNKLYRILEVAPLTTISLVIEKKAVRPFPKLRNLFSWWYTLRERRRQWPRPPDKAPSWKQQMDKVVEEYEDIFTATTGVPLHYQVKYSIDLTLGASLHNGPIYRCSILENDKIKMQIQELL